MISLPNNRIASCSLDNTIKIWKINKSYSKKPIRVLEGHGEWVTSLLYVKERDIMISGSFDKTHRGTLRLWDMSIYQCDNTIGGVGCLSTNSLYQIDKDRVIVGVLNFYLVNMIKLLKYGNINIIFVNHTLFQTFNVISSEHVTKVSELIATISFISPI